MSAIHLLHHTINIVLLTTLVPCLYTQSYIRRNESLSFSNHEALCQFAYNTHLASIHNESQYTEAKSLCSSIDCWIGINDITTENSFEWTDASLFDYATNISGGAYPWGPSEPNNDGDEDCVIIEGTTDYQWDDRSCSSSNYYALCNYPSPIYVFNDNKDYKRTPTASTGIATIDILDEIYIEFDVIVHSFQSGYTTILHIGNTDAERYPIIHIHDDNQIFTFAQTHISTPNYAVNSATIELEKWYHITYYLQQDWTRITVNDTELIDAATTSHAVLFDRNIYLSDPWYSASDVTISGLVVSTSNSNQPGEAYDYLCDYNNRFTAISGNWQYPDSCYIQQQNQPTIAGAVTWMGANDPSSILWTDYSVEAVLQIWEGEDIGILFRAQTVSTTNNFGKQYNVHIHAVNNEVVLAKMNEGFTELATYGTTIDYVEDYKLRVDIKGNTFYIYFNDELVITYTDTVNPHTHGSVGFRTYYSKGQASTLRVTHPTDSYLLTIDPTTAPSSSPTQPSIAPSTAPSQSPSMVPSVSPSVVPSSSPSQPPSTAPSSYPSQPPTTAPSQSPSMVPSESPSVVPSSSPSQPPSSAPSISPSQPPTTNPSLTPSSSPSQPPSAAPSQSPSMAPSVSPSIVPSSSPSQPPSAAPSISPSQPPTTNPSISPSISPSQPPSSAPSQPPSTSPSTSPSQPPSAAPSFIPSNAPTRHPNADPTVDPTIIPTIDPTADPTLDPTTDPTTGSPTADPTIDPTMDPTVDPTIDPTVDPTKDPTIDPTIDPTTDPTFVPTTYPTMEPTTVPTIEPTINPTVNPTVQPTGSPTTAEPSTSEPTTSEPTTSEPTTSEPTTTTDTDDDDKYTITIDTDATDLNEDDIKLVIAESLDIDTDDIISTDIKDGKIIILISVPRDVDLDEDTIKEYVTEGLVDEYGEEIDIDVDVSKTEPNPTEHPIKQKLLSNLDIVILTSIVAFLLCVICILLILLRLRSKQKNKADVDEKQMLATCTRTEGNGTLTIPTTEMQPIYTPPQKAQHTLDEPGRANDFVLDTVDTQNDSNKLIPPNGLRSVLHAMESVDDTGDLPDDYETDENSKDDDSMYLSGHNKQTPGGDTNDNNNNNYNNSSDSNDDDDDNILYEKGNNKTTKGAQLVDENSVNQMYGGLTPQTNPGLDPHFSTAL